jgi:integrase/recombinase XerD
MRVLFSIIGLIKSALYVLIFNLINMKTLKFICFILFIGLFFLACSKERIVPVGKYAQAAVAAYLVRVRPTLATLSLGTPALFLNQRGSRLSRQSIWQIISDAAHSSKLGVDVSPHTFRHSFATHLLEGGADVRVVQELLGHASVTTTQIYTLVTVDALREIYASSHPRAQR